MTGLSPSPTVEETLMPLSPLARRFALLIGVAALPGLALGMAGPAAAAPGQFDTLPVPDDVRAQPLDRSKVLAPALRKAKGTVTVSVALSEKALTETVAEDAIATRSLPSAARQRAQTRRVTRQQDRVVRAARALGAQRLGGATKAANVVALKLSAKNLDELAKIKGVVSVKPVARYETHADPGGSGSLAQAARYLQATSVRRAGYDGTGVRLAVIDSGVDFTHAYLGGPGTTDFYQTCYAQRDAAPAGACDRYFGPDAPKVKGGYDFIGESWGGEGDALVPDPNPIDREGHGTHVADIAAGKGPNHAGLAPGAGVYGLKVCSAIATSCSGVAILQALDWSLDPNDDGDLSDAMDVVNLSLGSAYGQPEDDSTVALDNLVRAGVVGVASAGNNADRPFIVGSPSAAPRAISVAQTALPDDRVYPITVNSPTIPELPGNTIRLAKLQNWSPAPTRAITGNLVPPNDTLQEGCTPATFAGFPAGAVALVKRGGCNASLKAQHAQAAGAAAIVIWNNVPGDPPDLGFGGGVPVTIPTLTIALEKARPVAAALARGPVRVTIDPAKAISSRNTVVGTTSRGLTIDRLRAKPDIGAPGAWLSAEVGTGDGQTNFGGTSGAAPVVAGAAALLLDRYPNASAATIKARLLNGADRNNATFDADANRYPTPVSRIGAGELRVAPAVNNRGVLRAAGSGNLGLGLPHLTRTRTYAVQLRLSNTSNRRKTYAISPRFREARDRTLGAVRVTAPGRVRVNAKSTRTITVRVRIDPRKLERWPFTHGAGLTSDGSALNRPEFDGQLLARSGAEVLHLGWTVLPHRSADVSARNVRLDAKGEGSLVLRNASRVLTGGVNVFGLTGTSPRLPRPAPGQPGTSGSNQAVIDLAAAGVRDQVGSGEIQFAVYEHRRRTIPLYPAGVEIDLDTDRDGDVDYAIFQQEAVGFGSSGQSLVYVLNVATEEATPYYYTDADYDNAGKVLTAPLSALGLEAGSTFDFAVLGYDNYFTGENTDAIQGQTWTVGAAKYALAGDAVRVNVPAGGTVRARVEQAADPVASTQTGMLLTYDDAVRRDFQAVTVTPTPAS